MNTERIFLYDTTLRDGAQSEGISFSADDKIDILRKFDSFGIPFVEGGWPGSSPRDDLFFEKAGNIELQNSELVAFGSTRRHGLPASENPNLLALAASPAKWCCIFGKSWDFHVTDALRISLEENLELISDSVLFLISKGKRVMFDAEHFFDGFYNNREYALKCIQAAAGAGAEYIILCDTNGGRLPGQISDAVRTVVSCCNVKIGIHCHNDCELAVANSLAAVSAGAVMVQGTVNGIGERCGNANLCSLIPDLKLKMNSDIGNIHLEGLTELSRVISEISNCPADSSLPYVGEKAFAHKGGMHVSALVRDPRTYEHIQPDLVGNSRRVLVSDMAGKASIGRKLSELGIDIDGAESRKITDMIKNLEFKGYEFEGADASFELLVRRIKDKITPPFKVEGFRVFIDDALGGMTAEASVKVRDSEGILEHTASDGHGPVNALDNALRKALSRFFPEMDRIRLVDYKVRVLDEKSATAASVRVLIRTSDGTRDWTTVGVSENVIEASLIALTDSFEYALMKL